MEFRRLLFRSMVERGEADLRPDQAIEEAAGERATRQRSAMETWPGSITASDLCNPGGNNSPSSGEAVSFATTPQQKVRNDSDKVDIRRDKTRCPTLPTRGLDQHDASDVRSEEHTSELQSLMRN